MENSISLYLDDVIPVECNLSSFEDFDLEIGDIKTNVKINNEKVFVDVDWNLNIKSGGDIKAVDEFSTDYNIRLISLRNFVMKIIENNNADKISIFSLIEPGYNVTIVPDDNDFVYLIKDANSEVFEEPFMFAFATNYE